MSFSSVSTLAYALPLPTIEKTNDLAAFFSQIIFCLSVTAASLLIILRMYVFIYNSTVT